MDKVYVLLSTYNGENYIRCQLDSIFNQTYKNITIYVRDDGSTDRTKEILHEYQSRKDKGVRLIVIEDTYGNLGYVKSFLRIVRSVPHANYYAFCDQDDFWMPKKIEYAVDELGKKDSKKCLLYTSAYNVTDEFLEVVGCWHRPTPVDCLDVGKALSLYDGGWLLGFTCLINDELKKKAFDNQVNEMYSHDIWLQAVVTFYHGEICIDERITTLFRRHNTSTSIAESDIGSDFLKTWVYRWNEAFGDGEMFASIKNSIVSFATQYQKEANNEKDIRFLRDFSDADTSVKGAMRKMMYPYRLKKSIFAELAWRLAIFLRKI